MRSRSFGLFLDFFVFGIKHIINRLLLGVDALLRSSLGEAAEETSLGSLFLHGSGSILLGRCSGVRVFLHEAFDALVEFLAVQLPVGVLVLDLVADDTGGDRARILQK